MTSQKFAYNFPERKDITPRSSLGVELLSIANVPERFWKMTLDDYEFTGKLAQFKPLFLAYINNLSQMHSDGCSLVLMGSNGCGKTMLASIIMQEALKRYYSSYYLTVTDLIERTFSGENLTSLISCDILVLDELGAETKLKSQSEVVTIERLLKFREEKKLPTIICTNLNKKEVSTRYGNTVYSLLDSYVNIIIVDADKRKSVARKTKARQLLSEAL